MFFHWMDVSEKWAEASKAASKHAEVLLFKPKHFIDKDAYISEQRAKWLRVSRH